MINNIQILHAFAAINVVLYHIIGTSFSYSQATTLFQYMGGWGASGVDVFFVISGFVMLHSQYLKRKQPFEFFKNRVIRIVPIYWVLTLFILFLYLMYPSIFREMLVTPAWITSSLFFTSSVFSGKQPVVYVGWTLEWEMLFYLIFAVGLFLKSWKSRAAFIVATFTIISVTTQNWIVFEFLFGMLAAYLYHKNAFSKGFGVVFFLLSAFLFILSLLPSLRDLNLNRVILWGVPAFFMVLGLAISTQLKSFFLSYLGDASYSIYLAQMLTIPAFYKVSSVLFANWHGDILALMCLIFSIAFGCIVHSLIERPITIRLKELASV